MATRMPLDADAQTQLLAIATAKGRGAQLYARFTPLVADLLARSSSSKATTTAENNTTLALLQSAFGARLESRVKAGLCTLASQTKKREPAATLAADVQRQYAAFAAKLAQSVIKAYAAVAVAQGATDADKKTSECRDAQWKAVCVLVTNLYACADQDLFVAMETATSALFVVLKFEGALKLGDLVLDNMLYQVAKKYAELPQVR